MKSSSGLEAAKSSWLASVLSGHWLRQLWRNPTIGRKADDHRQFFLLHLISPHPAISQYHPFLIARAHTSSEEIITTLWRPKIS
jgi:hypothetical protein